MSESPVTETLWMQHLDDEQFSALLAGETLPAAQVHLDGCAECRVEMERVAESMQSFSALGLEWAERRSATMAPVRVRRVSARPLVWASAAAVLAIGLMVGARYEQGGVTDAAAPQQAKVNVETPKSPMNPMNPMSSMVTAAPVQPARQLTREQQIAEDNRMLLAIRQELMQPDPSRTPGAGMRRARVAHTVND